MSKNGNSSYRGASFRCCKCGCQSFEHKIVYRNYNIAFTADGIPYTEDAEQDYLWVTCRRCGYSWKEPTLDSLDEKPDKALDCGDTEPENPCNTTRP